MLSAWSLPLSRAYKGCSSDFLVIFHSCDVCTSECCSSERSLYDLYLTLPHSPVCRGGRRKVTGREDTCHEWAKLNNVGCRLPLLFEERLRKKLLTAINLERAKRFPVGIWLKYKHYDIPAHEILGVC